MDSAHQVNSGEYLLRDRILCQRLLQYRPWKFAWLFVLIYDKPITIVILIDQDIVPFTMRDDIVGSLIVNSTVNKNTLVNAQVNSHMQGLQEYRHCSLQISEKHLYQVNHLPSKSKFLALNIPKYLTDVDPANANREMPTIQIITVSRMKLARCLYLSEKYATTRATT